MVFPRSLARTILVLQFVLEPRISLNQVHTSEHIDTLFHFNPRYAELTEKQANAPFHAGFPHRDLLPAECLAREISLALPVEVPRFLYPPDLAFRRIFPLGDFLRVKPVLLAVPQGFPLSQRKEKGRPYS